MPSIPFITQARDIFKNPLTGMIPSSTYVDNVVLAANTGQYVILPVPTTQNENVQFGVIIGVSGGSDLYIQFQTAGNAALIAVPSGTGTITAHAGTGAGVSLISSAGRVIPKNSIYLSMISPVACNVTLDYFVIEARV